MESRFIAYMPLTKLEAPPVFAVVDKIKQMFPKIPMVVDFSGNPNESSTIITIDKHAYAIIAIDQKLPQDAFMPAIEINKTWPQAHEKMLGQNAHLIISSLGEAKNHEEALAQAAAISIIVSALINMVPAICVIWDNGLTINEPKAFLDGALQLNIPQVSVENWVGFTFLSGPPTNDGVKTIAVLTTGLLPFIGYELEWLPTALPPITIMQRILGTCQYLISKGPIIKENDTLGISNNEHIRINFHHQGQRPGIPVAQLTLENLDNTPPKPAPLQGLGGTTPPSPNRPTFGRKK